MNGRVRATLARLGHVLPQPAPRHEFIPIAIVGNVAYVSGHAPFDKGAYQFQGKVGRDIDLPAARQAAQLAALGCLASLEAEIGSLDRVERIIKLNGYVNCDPDFKELPQVSDAASSLLIEVFGAPGRHARTTVGVASLPSGVAVELDMMVLLQVRNAKQASALEGLPLAFLGLAGHLVSCVPPSRAVPAWLRKVRDVLHKRFRETVRVADLAEAAGVHPVYLARIFRAHFGVTPGAYLRHLRVEWAAQQLVAKKDWPLTEIAAAAGFSDQSHFTRAFKQRFGAPPGQMRRLTQPTLP